MKITPSISTFEKRNGGGDSTIYRIGEPVLLILAYTNVNENTITPVIIVVTAISILFRKLNCK